MSLDFLGQISTCEPMINGWLGITTAETHLHRVMNLSRYLICSDGMCKNLGSYVLSSVLRRFSGDFSAQYGYEPYIVETFVGPEYEGTCFHGIGFEHLGLTKGQGRHAPEKSVCL